MPTSIEGTAHVVRPLRFAAFILPGLLFLGCGGSGTMLSTSPQLTGVEVTPQASSIAQGQTLQFKAKGIFSDGSSQDETQSAVWTSSNGAVASINSAGLATSLSVGSTSVIAKVRALSGSTSLNVSAAVIVSIAVDPSSESIPLGTTAQLKATGAFTDRSTSDVTNSVTWRSSDPNTAVVSSSGLAASKSTGNVSITATSGSAHASCQLSVLQPALASISVGANRSTIPLGTTAQFTAQGVYTDGSVRDLTGSVSWSSSPQGIVDVSTSGLATSLQIGTATVSAKSGAIGGSGTITVSAAVLSSIGISPANPTIPLGTTAQFTAQGVYTDGSVRDLTGSVSWSSSPQGIVDVSTSGLATSLQIGTATVSAKSGAIGGSGTITVSAAVLSSIDISPASPAIPLGSSLQLAATGWFTDGSKQDFTNSAAWNADNAAVVSLSGMGNAIALQVGSTGVDATSGGITGSMTITVQPIAATSYFTAGPSSVDTTFRITNPGGSEPILCAMVYVFDQNQQMAECCGCRIQREGLRTLSLGKDLIGNPLLAKPPVTGSVVLVTADYVSNPSCNASSITPTGMGIAWLTHLQTLATDSSAVSEETLSQTPLSTTLSSALQAQCQFIQQLGSGRGVCSCGTSY